MNRRIVAGWVVLALVGSSSIAAAMQMKDPSTAGTVGYTPLESITDRINGTATRPSTATAAGGVPTDPTASGPLARVPTPPVAPYPVGMEPVPAIDETIDQGYPTGGFGGFFRRPKRATTATPAKPRGALPPKLDPSARPSRLNWDEAGQEPSAMSGPTAATYGIGGNPSPRPAPYANQSPELPRRQLTSPPPDAADGAAITGRPAPLRSDLPRQGRRQIVRDPATGSLPRPQRPATGNPRMPPPVGPAPVIPSTLPGPEPAGPVALPPAAAPSPPPGGPAPTDPVTLPPLGPRAAAEPISAPAAADVAASIEPQPLAEPVPPPTTAVVADMGPPPAGMPKVLPDLAPVVAEPAPAAWQDVNLIQTSATGTASRLDPTGAESRAIPSDPTAIRIDQERDRNRPFASARAAAVGGEVITVHQVETLVAEQYKSMTASQEEIPEAERRMLINRLGSMALEHLINQSLVVQEAKGKMKSPKQKQAFDEFVDKRWHDDKLPGLLNKYATVNEYELKRKLSDEGVSYTEMVDNFKRSMIEQNYMYNEIRNKITIDPIQLRRYYNDHLHDFDQPARLSWREIEIDINKHPDRAAARRQADAVLARLAKKEDFAAVAQAASDGPTASKGGLYADMTPGAYGIVPVNDVLNTIPAGQISPVIEAPTSFHIVRVESRRPAGPLRYDEVQKQVAETVFEQTRIKACQEFIEKLRARTVVRVMPMFNLSRDGKMAEMRDDGSLVPASTR